MNEHVTVPTHRELGWRQADPSQYIKGALDDWEIVIGMEIHAQVQSNAKLFSGAATAFGAEPNTHVPWWTRRCRGCSR